jgi:hypothetical protein
MCYVWDFASEFVEILINRQVALCFRGDRQSKIPTDFRSEPGYMYALWSNSEEEIKWQKR